MLPSFAESCTHTLYYCRDFCRNIWRLEICLSLVSSGFFPAWTTGRATHGLLLAHGPPIKSDSRPLYKWHGVSSFCCSSQKTLPQCEIIMSIYCMFMFTSWRAGRKCPVLEWSVQGCHWYFLPFYLEVRWKKKFFTIMLAAGEKKTLRSALYPSSHWCTLELLQMLEPISAAHRVALGGQYLSMTSCLFRS